MTNLALSIPPVPSQFDSVCVCVHSRWDGSRVVASRAVSSSNTSINDHVSD